MSIRLNFCRSLPPEFLWSFLISFAHCRTKNLLIFHLISIKAPQCTEPRYLCYGHFCKGSAFSNNQPVPPFISNDQPFPIHCANHTPLQSHFCNVLKLIQFPKSYILRKAWVLFNVYLFRYFCSKIVMTFCGCFVGLLLAKALFSH